jgi:putative PEP-CTERM system histidine kinase
MATAILSFGGVALIYGLVIVLLLRGWRGRAEGLLVVAACAATVLWAGLGAAAGWYGQGLYPAAAAANVLRLGLWLWVCYGLWRLVTGGRFVLADRRDPFFWLGCGLVVVNAGLLGLPASPAGGGAPSALDVLALVGLGVFALALVESAFSAADSSGRWASKHLLIGLAGLFAFELFKVSEAFLLRRFVDATQVAQPLVALAVVPFVLTGARRIRTFTINVPVSRQAVLQTTALLASGVYLIAVALAGALFHGMDLAWGTALQLTFVLTAVLVLASGVASATVRAHARRFVERSFFDFNYDYRREWQRFVATMGGADGPHRPLRERAVQALADPLECTGGVLFLMDRSGAPRFVADWNWSQGAQFGAPPAALLARLSADRPALELPAGATAEAPGWTTGDADVAFVIALFHRERRLGVVALGKPRLRRELTWEDHELLALFAAQIANQLVEEENARALAETRRFEAVSRRFSFVAHDLKNVVTQLAPMVRLAHRHGDNPEFLRDVLTTVEEAVEKMQSTLLRLRAENADETVFELAPVVEDVVRRRRLAPLERAPATPPLRIAADRSAFVAVLENLVDNAFEAGGHAVRLALRAAPEARRIELDVVDDGPGMSAEFVRERLFEPFVSSKERGFGIGMYQCRSWVESWGGELRVDSVVGVGTTVTIRLPLVETACVESAPT